VTGLLRDLHRCPFPDLTASIASLASDDLVIRLVRSATQQGDLLGIPATGSRHLYAFDIYLVEGLRQDHR